MSRDSVYKHIKEVCLGIHKSEPPKADEARKEFTARYKSYFEAEAKPTQTPTGNDMTTPNRHAALIRQYAEEFILNPHAYENWETMWAGSSSQGHWSPCKGHPGWQDFVDYRRKAKTITIGGIEVPEPMRVAPEIGEKYHRADTARASLFDSSIWADDNVDNTALKRGQCHATKKAAIAHAHAIIIASGGTFGETK